MILKLSDAENVCVSRPFICSEINRVPLLVAFVVPVVKPIPPAIGKSDPKVVRREFTRESKGRKSSFAFNYLIISSMFGS